MKQILFLMAGLLALNTTANATINTTSETATLTNNYTRAYDKSFIFNVGGIEFSVYRDGQFDFYMSNYGPNVSIGMNTPGFTLSFNSGYNYNAYVQYDNYGAIVQIENTPVYYDHYGRVNQIGDIFITYNEFNRINRIGGLDVYYRNNRFWRYEGYINAYNNGYIWRPWHRFYSVPIANLCIVNTYPYRQYYAPVRHVWYRPYSNNVRYYNANYGRRDGTYSYAQNTSRRYVQTPRNNRERAIQRAATRRHTAITRTRNARVTSGQGIARNTSRLDMRSNSRTSSRSALAPQHSRTNDYNRGSRLEQRSTAKRSVKRDTRLIKKTKKNVTKTRPSVSNKIQRTARTSVKPSNTSMSREFNTTRPKSNQSQSTFKNKRKPSSVASKSDKVRRNNTRSEKSNTRRPRG
jgi:hypothetical protein